MLWLLLGFFLSQRFTLSTKGAKHEPARARPHLPLEIAAVPVALFLALEAVGVALAARVREGRALARGGVEVPLAQLVVARTFK